MNDNIDKAVEEQKRDSEIECPGCGLVLTPENAGGYRTFCKKCVTAMPKLPDNGAYYIFGVYPNFEWYRS